MTTQLQTVRATGTSTETEDSSRESFYIVGGLAALAIVAIVIIQAPIFILYPQPTTVLGHFTQIQNNKLLGLVDLDLMLILGEAFTVPVLIALFIALKKTNPSLMSIALGLGLSGIAFFIIVNPTFSFLYLSDQYAAATTDAQRAALLSAGEALWANYNGTAFGLFFILGGIADLMIAIVILQSSIFGKATAFTGMAMGAMMLVPPLPPFGMVALVLSYIVIVPSMIWNILLGIRFLQLAKANTASAPNQS